MGSLRQWGLPDNVRATVRAFLAPGVWPEPLCKFLGEYGDADTSFTVPPARWPQVVGCWAVAEDDVNRESLNGVLTRNHCGYFILGFIDARCDDVRHHVLQPGLWRLTIPAHVNVGDDHLGDWLHFYGSEWPDMEETDMDEIEIRSLTARTRAS